MHDEWSYIPSFTFEHISSYISHKSYRCLRLQKRHMSHAVQNKTESLDPKHFSMISVLISIDAVATTDT